MELHCDFCDPEKPKKPVIDFEFTHLGRSARFHSCSECAGIQPDEDGDYHGVDVSTIIYKLHDKVREQEEALRAAKPDTQ